MQNTAVVCNKTGDYREALRCCNKAVGLDEKAAKALFLRSNAHLKTNSFDDATRDCKAAIVIDPKNKSYRDHWELIKVEKAAKQKSQKAAMEKFFSKGIYNEKEAGKIEKVFDKLPEFKAENP